jgi:four helix bundle protein
VPQPQPLDERLLAFAVRVIRLVEALPKSLAGRRIGDQLLRSGVAVGAHYQESRAAESREDFVHQLQIALKELRESNYWLKVLTQAQILPANRIADLLAESGQLMAILFQSRCYSQGKSSHLAYGDF